MKTELKAPPAGPVTWTITRRDGLVATRTSQTAWQAVKQLHWAFMDCIDFVQESK